MFDWGGFGEILWGKLGGRRVALKVVSVHNNTYESLKVCIFLNEVHYLTLSW